MISVPESRRTTQLPSRCSPFFESEKWSIWETWRSPTTMSASPARIGATSLATSAPLYWLSASVLTTTSAPSFRQASRPAWKPAARPLLLVSRTMCSTPHSRATATVRSVEPSSMTSSSIASMPSIWRGRSAIVAGSVCSSLRQGIWMISFIGGRSGYSRSPARGWPRGRRLRAGKYVRSRHLPRGHPCEGRRRVLCSGTRDGQLESLIDWSIKVACFAQRHRSRPAEASS